MKRVILRIIVCFMLMPVCAFAATRRDSDGAVASRTTGAVVMRSNVTNSRGTSVTPSPASDREIKRSSISRVVPAEAESRAVANVRSRTAKNVTSRVMTPVVAGRSTGQRAATVSRTAVTNNAPTNRTGITRGGVASRKNTTNSTRALKTRAATTQSEEKKDVASLIEGMTSQADLANFCKTKYSECMDNFCNVLDEKQGRCSCSKNVKNYEKSENGLKQATAALQDVAQQIQYIGLTANEIDTLFAETEAEAAMSGTSDNSQLKNDLDKIKGLIVDVKPGTASSSDMSNDLSLDLSGLLDFNFSSSGFDLGTLFGTQSANTNSISNQRGEQLYKTAAARCRTDVLNECKKLGVDISVVINSYDMTIDRECIAYERTLNESNDEMLQTVRNAQSVLQRARLMVAQQKNSYDLRGCISALDSCMQDDFVCGSDYEKCLDPTGKYIVDGEIIVGSAPGRSGDVGNDGLYDTWDYSNSNAWGSGSIDDYLKTYLTATYPESNLTVMANYLHNKIGKITDDGRAQGMCVAVLNRCRDYTYTEGKNGKYIPNNRVIREWMERTFIKIKNAQDSLLANYAESCVSDVTSCLTENNYDKSDKKSTKSNVAINACSSRILTCMSVNADTSTSVSDTMIDWVAGIMGASSANQGNSGPGGWGDLWGASKLTINFDVDGGTSVASTTCTIGDTFTLPESPSKSGYKHVGWYVKGVLTTETRLLCDADTLGVTNGAATIKAAWKFDYSAYQNLCERDGNGTWNTGNNTCTCNEGYALGSDNTCVYKGDEEPATTITVKYDTDGGTSVADATYTVGGTFTLPVAPSKDGYTFDGWTIGTAKYDAGAELVLSDILTSGQTEVTVTATWMPNTITILFEDPKNYLDNWSDVETSCTYGGTLDLSKYPIKGEGYVWNANGVKYEYNQTIDCTKDILGVDSGDISIVLDTRSEQVMISYDTDGGTSVADATCAVGSTFTLPNAPTKSGYTFDVWAVNDNEFKAGESADCTAEILGVSSGAATITARWIKDNTSGGGNGSGSDDTGDVEPATTITVKYNTDGGTSVADATCTVGTTFALPVAPTRDGYTFRGWSVNGTTYGANATVYCNSVGLGVSSGDVTMNAVWLGNTISLDFNNNDGNGTKTTGTCRYGETFTLPEAPTRLGYTFLNWEVNGGYYSASETTNCDKDVLGVYSGSVDVTAEWEPAENSIEILFNTDGGTEAAAIRCVETYMVTFPEVTKPGYTLEGWYLNTNNTVFDADDNFRCEHNVFDTDYDSVTFRAVWKNDTTGESSLSDMTSGMDKCLDLNGDFIDCDDMSETDIVVNISTNTTGTVYYNGVALSGAVPMGVNYQAGYGSLETETEHGTKSTLPDLHNFVSGLSHSEGYYLKGICSDRYCLSFTGDIMYYIGNVYGSNPSENQEYWGRPKNIVHSELDAENGTVWYMIWQDDTNSWVTGSSCGYTCQATVGDPRFAFYGSVADCMPLSQSREDTITEAGYEYIKTLGRYEDGEFLVNKYCALLATNGSYCVAYKHDNIVEHYMHNGTLYGRVAYDIDPMVVPCDISVYPVSGAAVGPHFLIMDYDLSGSDDMSFPVFLSKYPIDLTGFVSYWAQKNGRKLKGIYMIKGWENNQPVLEITDEHKFWDGEGNSVQDDAAIRNWEDGQQVPLLYMVWEDEEE